MSDFILTTKTMNFRKIKRNLTFIHVILLVAE